MYTPNIHWTSERLLAAVSAVLRRGPRGTGPWRKVGLTHGGSEGWGPHIRWSRHGLCTALSQQERHLLLSAVIRPPLPRDEQLHSFLYISRACKAWSLTRQSLVPARVCRTYSPATTASRWGVLGCPRTAVFFSFLVTPWEGHKAQTQDLGGLAQLWYPRAWFPEHSKEAHGVRRRPWCRLRVRSPGSK